MEMKLLLRSLKLNMHNTKTNNKLNILILLFIGLLFYSLITEQIYALDKGWVEVQKTDAGRQLWNTDSFKKISKDLISIESIYITSNSNEINRTKINFLYSMEIDCKRNLYKDTSVNGYIVSDNKWKETKDDLLIYQVANQSCASSNL